MLYRCRFTGFHFFDAKSHCIVSPVVANKGAFKRIEKEERVSEWVRERGERVLPWRRKQRRGKKGRKKWFVDSQWTENWWQTGSLIRFMCITLSSKKGTGQIVLLSPPPQALWVSYSVTQAWQRGKAAVSLIFCSFLLVQLKDGPCPSFKQWAIDTTHCFYLVYC